ncbi:hypothetical protein [Flavobacterium restrictum]|uniref:Lipocalin-like domain-containing protein n=1 Tax=Flavobacterium restrictum TaxID=2594428 RepID=A0A553E2Z9_9FLAO|nr:hypothetical protein [Flavobacterium restrictum]TRX39252.1 hypothetical protein FNW21_09980 [Flavobacterium restrictum]
MGSITGNSVETPTSTGIERKLVFTNDGKVMVYATGQETRSVAYEIKQGKTIFDDLDHNLLVFDGMTYVISHIDASSLILDDNFPDGYHFHYKR